MGLFVKKEKQEQMDKFLSKYLNEDILFDGKNNNRNDKKIKDILEKNNEKE